MGSTNTRVNTVMENLSLALSTQDFVYYMVLKNSEWKKTQEDIPGRQVTMSPHFLDGEGVIDLGQQKPKGKLYIL